MELIADTLLQLDTWLLSHLVSSVQLDSLVQYTTIQFIAYLAFVVFAVTRLFVAFLPPLHWLAL